MKQGQYQLRRITAVAMLAAISYVVFTFLQIKISLPGGDATSIHLGNAVCVLGALLMGGFAGGLGGAIGMTIGDLFDRHVVEETVGLGHVSVGKMGGSEALRMQPETDELGGALWVASKRFRDHAAVCTCYVHVLI